MYIRFFLAFSLIFGMNYAQEPNSKKFLQKKQIACKLIMKYLIKNDVDSALLYFEDASEKKKKELHTLAKQIEPLVSKSYPLSSTYIDNKVITVSYEFFDNSNTQISYLRLNFIFGEDNSSYKVKKLNTLNKKAIEKEKEELKKHSDPPPPPPQN